MVFEGNTSVRNQKIKILENLNDLEQYLVLWYDFTPRYD